MASFNLEWSAPEFEYRERDVSWYWISIIVATVLIAFAVWQRDFLFGFFIVIAEILAIIWASRLPRTITFSMSERELSIDDRKHYHMADIESFSVDAPPLREDGVVEENFAELMFHFKGKLRTPVFILVPMDQLETIKKNLRLVMREIDHQITFIDSLERWIGF